MNVLVTGAAGLIGMSLREVLPRLGHTVIATDITDYGRGDAGIAILGLDDTAGLAALVESNHIDAVVHCGGISGPMLARGQPMLMLAVNTTATAALLELSRKHHVRRFVFCSSIGVYGNVGPGVLIGETTPMHPTTVYGASKLAAEALVDAFAVEYGVDGIGLRIPRVYGPYRRANCHLGTIVRDAEAGRPTTIATDPRMAYHYMYVDDVAEVIGVALAAPTLPARIYNVGTGIAQTMPEILAIARVALPDARIALEAGEDDVPDLQEAFDVTSIAHDLGWTARFDIATGLLAYREALSSGRAA